MDLRDQKRHVFITILEIKKHSSATAGQILCLTNQVKIKQFHNGQKNIKRAILTLTMRQKSTMFS